MGLFSRKKKEPLPPLEHYLEQKSAETLLNAGKKIMRVGITIRGKKDNLPNDTCISPSFTDFFTVNDPDYLGEQGTDTVPSAYKGYGTNSINSWMLFRYAAKKGSGEAALYAAIGYEHGLENALTSQLYDGKKSYQSQHEADKYYDMAIVLDESLRPLIDVINAIKSDMWWRRDLSEAQDVTLAMNLWMNNIEGSKHYSEVVALDNKLRSIYLFISSYLLWAYAELSKIEDVWAIGTLSSVLINYDGYVRRKEFYNFNVSLDGGQLGLGLDKTIENAGKIMRYEVWQKAQRYEKAANFCRQFDIYY